MGCTGVQTGGTTRVGSLPPPNGSSPTSLLRGSVSNQRQAARLLDVWILTKIFPAKSAEP